MSTDGEMSPSSKKLGVCTYSRCVYVQQVCVCTAGVCTYSRCVRTAGVCRYSGILQQVTWRLQGGGGELRGTVCEECPWLSNM